MSNDHDGTDKAREADPSDLTDATADDATAGDLTAGDLRADDLRADDAAVDESAAGAVDGTAADSVSEVDDMAADGGRADDARAEDAAADGAARTAHDDADPDQPAIEVELPHGSARDDTALVAATAGSARAAARRSTVRAGTTAPKGVATAPREGREKKDNIFVRVGRFLREVVAELGKVIWPTRKEMITYTVVVIAFVVFMIALVAGLDVLFAKGVLAVFG